MRFVSSTSRRVLSAVLASNLCLASVASAAPAPEAPRPAAPATPIEEVRLEDGTLLRGTILERTAAGDVTFSLSTGEVRKLAKKDILYAGPIGGAPLAPAAAPAPAPPALAARTLPEPPLPSSPGAPVAFKADQPDMLVHLRGASATTRVSAPGYDPQDVQLNTMLYSPICIAPCTGSVPLGIQRFGLSHGSEAVLDVDGVVDTRTNKNVAFHVESNEPIRSTGQAIFWSGIVAGSAASLIGLGYAVSASNDSSPLNDPRWAANEQKASDQRTTGWVVSAAGLVVGAGIAVLGAFLQRTHDHAALAPASSAPSPASAAPSAVPAAPKPAPGEGGFPGSSDS